MKRRRSAWVAYVLLVAAVAIGAILGRATIAQAHAVLVRSSPAAEARLQTSPPAIDLWFSEPLEARFSTFELLGSTGRPLPLDGVVVDQADALHMSGLPRRLPGGVYTVAYRAVSQLDGHEWSGTFAFTVLNADGSVPTGAAFVIDVERGSVPALVAGRWLLFVGFSMLIGGAVLTLPGMRRPAPAPGDAIARDAALLQRRLAFAALPVLIGGLLLTLLNQALALDASALEVLFDSRFGAWWLNRAAVVAWVLALLAAVAALPKTVLAPRSGLVALVLMVLGVAGLATITAQSHAAASPGAAWAIAFDLVHMVAAGLWVGGLLSLAALFVRGRGRGPLHSDALVQRWVLPFSGLAAGSIFVLTLTGVLRALGELPTANALVATSYGQLLLVKLGVIALALSVAYVNRSTLQRRGPGAERQGARLRTQLLAEAALACGVLLTVAVLGQVPTARGYAQPPAPTAGTIGDFNAISSADDLSVHLQVSPATLGTNQLRAHVYRPDGSDPGEITGVRFTLAATALSGGQQLQGVPQGSGIFLTTEGLFSLARSWNVRVEVARAGRDDIAVAYNVPIGDARRAAEAAGPFSSPAPQLTLNALFAMVLVICGAAVLLTGGRQRSTSRAGGAVLIGAAVMLWISGGTHAADIGGFPANPVPSDAASQARGAALYAQYCVECHGPDGNGDGPVAETLNPRPASLAVHIPVHPDGQAFIFISKGFPGTAMSAWESRLTEEQRWDLVNYLRALTTTQVR